MARIITLTPNSERPISIAVLKQALSVRKNSMLLQKVLRKVLITVAAAYKTAPSTALQVITGIPPIDLKAREKRFIYERKGEETARRAKTRILHF